MYIRLQNKRSDIVVHKRLLAVVVVIGAMHEEQQESLQEHFCVFLHSRRDVPDGYTTLLNMCTQCSKNC